MQGEVFSRTTYEQLTNNHNLNHTHTPTDDNLFLHPFFKTSSMSGPSTVSKKERDDIFETLRCFVEHGADINAIDVHGRGALYLAVKRNSIDMVKYLLEHGAKTNLPGKYVDVGLFLTVGRGNLAILKQLVENGANINIENGAGDTLLTYAMDCKQYAIARYLVECEPMLMPKTKTAKPL